MAAVYSAYVVVVALMQWSIHFDTYNSNLFEILLGYFFGGLSAGALMGVLRPYNATAWGRALIGLIAGGPVVFGFCVVLFGGPARWTSDNWVTLGIAVVLLGPLAGLATLASARDGQ